jgi:hypothetical protein
MGAGGAAVVRCDLGREKAGTPPAWALEDDDNGDVPIRLGLKVG